MPVLDVYTRQKEVSMITFRKVELEDQAVYREYMAKQQCRSCECTFANLYLWSRFYNVTAAVADDMLLTKSEYADYLSFGFPMGDLTNLKTAVEDLKIYSREKGFHFQMHNVTPEQFAVLEEQYPGRFRVEYRRDYADYVYEAEKLAKLSGKKYHGKKNHINKFKKTYPDWSYESLGNSNLEECFQMALNWRRMNGCEEDEEKNSEMCVTLNSLRLFHELGLSGGLIRADGRVVAFSIGEPVTGDTFVVHIEKAYADVPGAYPMINQQFVEHEAEGFTYINREEDMGEEGLRSAKESYRPVFMVEKGIVTEKEGE